MQEIPSLIVTTTADVIDDTDGLTSLREAIAFANDATAGDLSDGDADNDGNANDTITFADGVGQAFENGGLIRLVQGELVITDAVSIIGAGDVTITGDADDDDVTVDGDITDVLASGAGLLDDNSRILNIANATSVTSLTGLVLTGGRGSYTYTPNAYTRGSGGAIYTKADIALTDTVVAGNNVDKGDGAGIDGLRAVTLVNSAITGNHSTATNTGVGYGGGIYASGAVSLTDSIVNDNGSTGNGGGIYSDSDVTLTNSIVSGNRAAGDYGRGGGVFAAGALTLTMSTVSGNSTSGQDADGGGLFSDTDITLYDSTVSENTASGGSAVGGGIYGRDSVSLTNSTVSGNSTNSIYSGGGGGINSFRSVTLINSTVSGNSTSGTNSNGGGVYTFGVNGTGITVTGSIISGNIAIQSTGDDLLQSGTTATYLGTNIVGTDLFNGSTDIGDVSAVEIFAATFDNNGVDAGVLADNGGPVQTIALRADASNPALDAASGTNIPMNDARGIAAVNLPNVGAETGDGIRDIGAFELQELPSLIVTTLADNESASDGLLSLREAIELANDQATTDADGDGSDLDTITFDASLLGGEIDLSSELVLTSDIVIDGDIDRDGIADIAIDGENRNRLFSVDSASTTLQNLTLRRGNADIYFDGGAIYVAGQASLNILGSIISDSQAVDGNAYLGQPQGGRGGAIFASSGSTVTVADSTFTGNRGGEGAPSIYYGVSGAVGGDGGAIWSAGDLTITNSIFQNNRAGDAGDADLSGDDGGNGGSGGAIFSSGTLAIDASTFSGNRAGNGGQGEGYDPATSGGDGGNGGGGGGIRSTGALTIANSEITGNSAGNGGRGAYGYGGGDGGNGGSGGGLLANGSVNMANTTFSANSAGNGGRGGNGLGYFGGDVYSAPAYVGGDGGNGGSGGAMGLTGGTVDLANVTAAGNTAGNAGNGAYGYLQNGSSGTSGVGGGVFGNNTTLSIAHGTLTGNSAGTSGGGLAVTGGTVEIINSLVLGNSGGEVSGTVTETSSITTGDAAQIFDAIDGATGGGALADNGGPVQTVALLASLTNPAIDAGTGTLPADTLDLDGDVDVGEDLPVDARGFTRDVDVPGVGGTPDIGAFETQTTDTPGPDILIGTSAADLILADQGGADLILALDDDDGIFFGANFGPGAQVDAGDGDADQLGLQGDYSGGVSFGPGSTEGVETVVLLPGSDTRFGAAGTELFSYNLTLVDANIAAGEQLAFQANTLEVGEDFALDASSELDGSIFTFGGFGDESITGGQQDDAFFFGEGRFGTGDKIDGQGGTFDSVGLQGDFSELLELADDQLDSVEILALLSSADPRFFAGSATPFSYNLAIADGNVAAGESLIVSANNLLDVETLSFDGSLESDGRYQVFSGNGDDTIIGSQNADTISGRGGADTITGNGGDDTFLYTNLFDSAPGAEDFITDFSTGDLISLVSLDADTGLAGDQAFAFIGAVGFSNVAGELRAVNTSGDDWIIEGDVDGDAVADLSITLAISDGSLVEANDFIL